MFIPTIISTWPDHSSRRASSLCCPLKVLTQILHTSVVFVATFPVYELYCVYIEIKSLELYCPKQAMRILHNGLVERKYKANDTFCTRKAVLLSIFVC